MGWRSRGLIDDVRQFALRLPIRVTWVENVGEVIARTSAGVLRVVRLPWRWWDGFLDGVPAAAGFTRDEVLRNLRSVEVPNAQDIRRVH